MSAASNAAVTVTGDDQQEAADDGTTGTDLGHSRKAVGWWDTHVWKEYRQDLGLASSVSSNAAGSDIIISLNGPGGRAAHTSSSTIPITPHFGCGTRDYGDLGHLLEPVFVFQPWEIKGWDTPKRDLSPERGNDSTNATQDKEKLRSRQMFEAVAVKPTIITMGALESIRQSIEEGISDTGGEAKASDTSSLAIHRKEMPTTDPLAKIIDDLTAVSKFLTHRAVNRNAQDSGIRQARTRSRLFLTFLKQLRELALSNNAAQKIAHARNKFSDPINLKQWIREEMQERWEAKHGSPTFAALRTQLKIRADSAKAAGNEREQRAVAREKRHLMKTIFTECVQEELREIWDDLQGELLYPLRDLGVLHSLRNGQNFILMRDRCTTLELVEELDRSSGQTQDLVGKDSHFLKSQLDALLSLMAIGLRTAAALETRLNRLSAKDVRDRDEREAVKQRRLSQPEALLYLSKASEDLQFIRDYSQTVVAGFGNVESEMGRLADAAIDTLAAGERCAIALEGQKRKVTV